MTRLEQARVRRNTRISSRLWWCEYDSPAIAAEALPGQFAHILCGPEHVLDPMLRRPFSFSRIDRVHGHVALLVDVVGRGSDWLVTRAPGTEVNFLGPLGTCFALEPKRNCALMVGGGIGLAPLIALADDASAHGVEVVMLVGGRNQDAVTPSSYLADGVNYVVATEDGSLGHHGRVTELVPEHFDWADQVFVCGPTPMMRAMARITTQLDGDSNSKSIHTSLEARMGCAMGVCYSCVVKTTSGVRRVCRDGPVFAQQELTWEWGHSW